MAEIIPGKWKNAVGTNLVHYFTDSPGFYQTAICNGGMIVRDGSGGRLCRNCEKSLASEIRRREKERKSRTGLIEKLSNLDNSTALDRLIELVGDFNSEWGYAVRDDSIERDELERIIRYRLTYYVYGEP